MSKWINAEKLIGRFNSYVGFTTRPDVTRAIKIIQDELGIDLIRCKECKWFGHIGCAIKIVDDSDKPGPDDYCSFAEREESERHD